MGTTKETWFHNDVVPYYMEAISISGEERIVVKEVESLADAELICLMQNENMSDLRFYMEKQDLKRALYDLYVNDAKENSDYWNAVMRNNEDGTCSMYTFEEFRMLYKEILPVWSMLRNNRSRRDSLIQCREHSESWKWSLKDFQVDLKEINEKISLSRIILLAALVFTSFGISLSFIIWKLIQ